MTHRVVKPFPFAGNGYAVENLNAGDERDFGASTDGLLDEGYIVAVGSEPVSVVAATVAAETASEDEQATAEPAGDTAIEETAAPRRGRQRRG